VRLVSQLSNHQQPASGYELKLAKPSYGARMSGWFCAFATLVPCKRKLNINELNHYAIKSFAVSYEL